MESYSKKSKVVKNPDRVQLEFTKITPNDDERNDHPYISTKNAEVQTDKITSRNARVQTKNTPDTTVPVRIEHTAVVFDHKKTNDQRDIIHHDVEIGSSLDLPRQEIVDQRESQTADDSATRNQRMVDAPREQLITAPTAIIDIVEETPSLLMGYADEPLLPLSEACAPLNDIIYNLSFYVQLALDETAEKPPDGLTTDESAAIRLYTIEWEGPHRSLYSMLNYTLKMIDREGIRLYFRYLKLFITGLAKLPCVPLLTVWRGVTKNLSSEFPPGTSLTWWAFSSCTHALTVLENNMYLGSAGDRTLFSVEAMNGRTIQAHSHFVTEDEILLLPGTHMIVQSQFSPAPNLYVIHLKQVIPDEVLLEPPFEGAHLYPKTIRFWYRKKRFVIPIFLLLTLVIAAAVIGAVVASKSHQQTIGLIFDILLQFWNTGQCIF